MPHHPYSPEVAAWIDPGDGVDRESIARELNSLTPESLVTVRPMDALAAEACLAGLWLRHGFLDESHRISQQLPTPEGAYWHAIMHRLEGDLGNSRYWLRQVGGGPLVDFVTGFRIEKGDASSSWPESGVPWKPEEIVDLAAAAASDRSAAERYRRASDLEWRALFAWCWDLAHAAE